VDEVNPLSCSQGCEICGEPSVTGTGRAEDVSQNIQREHFVQQVAVPLANADAL